MIDKKEFDKLLEVPKEIKNKLGLESKQVMNRNILNIFELATEVNKNELTLDEIVSIYYNRYTKDTNSKLKTKKDIVQKLYMLRLAKKLELVPHKRGIYRLKVKND